MADHNREQRQLAAAIFAGAAEIISENRARAAARPLRPGPPVEVLMPVLNEGDPPEPGCRCHSVPHPPCTWCEEGNWREDGEADDEGADRG